MWSEDALHRWLAARDRPRVLAGSAGHDAAVLRRREGRAVTCVDQTIEGVHFDADVPPLRVGAKAAKRALSDLAATAARPHALLLALSAPLSASEPWLRKAIRGVAECGAAHGAELVGGDLAAAPGPVRLSVTAIGALAGRRRPPGRDQARPGQCLVITGPVGGSALGRHLAFEPRLAEGAWLHELGATAMMDVSDGLAWDLFRLARASDVAIDLYDVPEHADAARAERHDGIPARQHALDDGEDHELVATLSKRAFTRALREAPRHCPDLRLIGRVREGRGLWIEDGDDRRPWQRTGGWRHGG